MAPRPLRPPAFPGFLLELAFPRSCAACGAELFRLDGAAVPGPRGGRIRGAPVCPACAASLAPFRGARCGGCGRPLVSERENCLRCRSGVRSYGRALPLHAYAGTMAALLKAWKIGGRRSFAGFFAALAEPVLEEMGAREPGTAIVPVPPRAARLRERGWDQVEDLAASLGRRGFRIERCLVRRGRAEQKRLDLEARLANARSSYALKPGAVPPGRAILVDDVLTTGATVEACAAALLAGGCGAALVLTLAAD